MIYAALIALALLATYLGWRSESHKANARHWEYIASHLRRDLNAATDELDKHGPSDATTPSREILTICSQPTQQKLSM